MKTRRICPTKTGEGTRAKRRAGGKEHCSFSPPVIRSPAKKGGNQRARDLERLLSSAAFRPNLFPELRPSLWELFFLVIVGGREKRT